MFPICLRNMVMFLLYQLFIFIYTHLWASKPSKNQGFKLFKFWVVTPKNGGIVYD